MNVPVGITRAVVRIRAEVPAGFGQQRLHSRGRVAFEKKVAVRLAGLPARRGFQLRFEAGAHRHDRQVLVVPKPRGGRRAHAITSTSRGGPRSRVAGKPRPRPSGVFLQRPLQRARHRVAKETLEVAFANDRVVVHLLPQNTHDATSSAAPMGRNWQPCTK